MSHFLVYTTPESLTSKIPAGEPGQILIISPSGNIEWKDQSAIDIGQDVSDLRALSGTVDGETDLGTFTGTTIADASDVKTALQALETSNELKIPLSEKGMASGVATLDAGGKVPVGQLPSAVMTYEVVWNASTNSPTLADGIGDVGAVYRVGTAGSQNLGSGSISFNVGDYAIYNGSIWEKSATSDSMAIGVTIGGSPATGSVLFVGTSSTLQNNTNLTWDNTNNRLGLGTAAPTAKLTVTETASQNAITINQSSTSRGILINQTSATGGRALDINQSGASNASAAISLQSSHNGIGFNLTHSNATSTASALTITSTALGLAVSATTSSGTTATYTAAFNNLSTTMVGIGGGIYGSTRTASSSSTGGVIGEVIGSGIGYGFFAVRNATGHNLGLTNGSPNFGNISIDIPFSMPAGNSYGITLPSAQGTVNQTLRNDGTGILTWVTPGAFATDNTFIGSSAGNGTLTGTGNSAFGRSALVAVTSASDLTAVGKEALLSNTSGASNTAVGRSALRAVTTGTQNAAFGSSALAANTASNNTAMGAFALFSNTSATNNTAVGSGALQDNTGSNNTALGAFALNANTSSINNTAVGTSALQASSGAGNTSVGTSSLQVNTTGTNNVAMGLSSLATNTTGASNTAVGKSSLALNTGSNNTSLGFRAGDAVTSGSTTTLIGSNANVSIGTLTDATAIGANSIVSVSNGLVLGTSTTMVGIQNSSPAAPLDIGRISASESEVMRFTYTSDANYRNYLTSANNGTSGANYLKFWLKDGPNPSYVSPLTLSDLAATFTSDVVFQNDIGIHTTLGETPLGSLEIVSADGANCLVMSLLADRTRYATIKNNFSSGFDTGNYLSFLVQNAAASQVNPFTLRGDNAALFNGTLGIAGSTFFSYFQGNGAQAADITYTLPASDGTAFAMLQTDGLGGLTWAGVQGTGGVNTAGAVYTSNEQGMVQTMWDALRSYGILS